MSGFSTISLRSYYRWAAFCCALFRLSDFLCREPWNETFIHSKTWTLISEKVKQMFCFSIALHSIRPNRERSAIVSKLARNCSNQDRHFTYALVINKMRLAGNFSWDTAKKGEKWIITESNRELANAYSSVA